MKNIFPEELPKAVWYENTILPYRLSLREYYAGQALAGLTHHTATRHRNGLPFDEIAIMAVGIADAVIAELEKEQ